MKPDAERIRWVDALRGAAVLAIVPLNARWILHPADAYHDPSLQGPPGVLAWLWWAIPELLFDHSTLFVLAAVFGISLSAARAADADPGWTRRHRARLFLLAAAGFAHGALIWPGDILYPYALTAMLLTGAVRQTGDDTDTLLRLAVVAAAVPPTIGLWALYATLGGYEAAGFDPATSYVLATPEYPGMGDGALRRPVPRLARGQVDAVEHAGDRDARPLDDVARRRGHARRDLVAQARTGQMPQQRAPADGAGRHRAGADRRIVVERHRERLPPDHAGLDQLGHLRRRGAARRRRGGRVRKGRRGYLGHRPPDGPCAPADRPACRSTCGRTSCSPASPRAGDSACTAG